MAVETSPRPVDDARLAAIAATDDMILCYVNNLHLLDVGFDKRPQAALKDPKWRGLRLRPIESFDLTSNVLMDALAQLENKGHVELGISVPNRLNVLHRLCRALPNVRFVLTHCGHRNCLCRRDNTTTPVLSTCKTFGLN